MEKAKSSLFDAEFLLASAGVSREVLECQRKTTIVAQDNSSNDVKYKSTRPPYPDRSCSA